jgi:hypothetical protein
VSANGFRVHSISKEWVEASHHQRVYWDEVVEDPAGDTYTIKRVRIVSVGFFLYARPRMNLLLVDPPRTVVPMLTDLSLQFADISVSKMAVDTRRWVEHVQRTARVLRHEIYSFSNIRIGETIVSHAVSVVGNHDLRDRPLGGQFANSSPKAIRLSIEVCGQSASIEVFSDCRAHVLSGDSDAVRSVLSEALAGVG